MWKKFFVLVLIKTSTAHTRLIDEHLSMMQVGYILERPSRKQLGKMCQES